MHGIERDFWMGDTPSQSTFADFSKNSAGNLIDLFHRYRMFFDQLRFDIMTLDLDSSVLTRYGEQEGAEWLHPKKPEELP
jgi:hypothetical protein